MIAIGVDIGGSSIKGAAITSEGKILDYFAFKMDRLASPEDTFSLLSDEINKFLLDKEYKKEIVGIGLGVPGILDKEKGIIKSSPNMPLWINFNVKEFVEKRTLLPVKIVNDASSAVLGEAKFGSGKNFQNIVMVTLGTGVGGGLFLNGQLFDGKDGTGAQIGHAVIEYNGRQCSCGRKGCLEAYASATALTKEARLRKEHYKRSLLNTVESIGAKTVFDMAKRGDSLSIQLVNEYIVYLSEGLLNFCNIFRPDIILLSGGIANEGSYLIDRVVDYMKKRNYGYVNAPIIPVKVGKLGYDAGKVGAATLFFD